MAINQAKTSTHAELTRPVQTSSLLAFPLFTGNGNSILLYFYLWTFLISLSLARPVIGTPQSAAMGLEPQESSSFRTVECGLWTRPRIFLLKNFNWRVKTRVSKINSPRNGIIKQVQVHSLNLRSRKLNADQPPRHRRAFNFGLEYIYFFWHI